MNPSKEQVLQQLDVYFEGTPMSLAGRSQIKDRGSLRFALDQGRSLSVATPGLDLATNKTKLSAKHQ